MRILLIAPYYSRTTPGESWSTYKWVEGIARHHDVTVLTTHKAGWDADSSPTQARVINFVDCRLPKFASRFDHQLKPGYILFYFRCRRWMSRHRFPFDLVHQINPLGLRYPSPAASWDIPYIIGPLAGSLSTPPGFTTQQPDRQWYRKLRKLDSLRIKYDPLLNRTYRNAAAILGVAPYVESLLQPAGPRRFYIVAETGVESVEEGNHTRCPSSRELNMLFVGRLIQTKGVLEAIQATIIARREAPVRLDILGDGELRHAAAEMIKCSGAESYITLHGRVSRETVSAWYQRSDLFLFPSYREPSGNVVFEAMSHGLPIITTTAGGPGYVVTPECGVTIAPVNSSALASGSAQAILALANDPTRLCAMSRAAKERIKTVALWDTKIERLLQIYDELINSERRDGSPPPFTPFSQAN